MAWIRVPMNESPFFTSNTKQMSCPALAIFAQLKKDAYAPKVYISDKGKEKNKHKNRELNLYAWVVLEEEQNGALGSNNTGFDMVIASRKVVSLTQPGHHKLATLL